MRSFLPLLALLMLVLTGWSAMTHVAEDTGGRLAGWQLLAHAPGDGDEVPGDRDNSMPHHHSACHGHDVGTPALPLNAPSYALEAGPRPGTSIQAMIPADEQVALRPPQA